MAKNIFRAGDRVVYCGGHPLYFSRSRIGKAGIVKPGNDIRNYVIVDFDDGFCNYETFPENLELERKRNPKWRV